MRAMRWRLPTRQGKRPQNETYLVGTLILGLPSLQTMINIFSLANQFLIICYGSSNRIMHYEHLIPTVGYFKFHFSILIYLLIIQTCVMVMVVVMLSMLGQVSSETGGVFSNR